MRYEDPAALAGRLRLGREEFCQRLLTTLILGGTYPRWNTRSTPTPQGAAFLRHLDELSFGRATPPDAEVFVDELELRPRLDAEQGGAPDWAVFWPGRLWLIELKTERGSHRSTQLPYYFELGSHHYPGLPVDITYLTGPLEKPAPTTVPGQRYAHLTWDAVLPLVRRIWGGEEAREVVRYVQVLDQVIDGLPHPWSHWRAAAFAAAPEPALPTENELMDLIRATAADGQQRALDAHPGSLEDLLALRLTARELIQETSADSGLRHVLPWLWSGQDQSMGQPLTPAGAEHGYELRFSRYRAPVYREAASNPALKN
jgi:hypothetical protein